MRVLTTDNILFHNLCSKLATKVCNDGFLPDVIVGIASGGSQVATIVAQHFKDAILTEVDIHRSTKRGKNSKISRKILAILPFCLLDWLRMAESYFCSIRKTAKRIGEVNFRTEIAAKLAKGCKVLIVDDAIDSGTTMKLAVEEISQKFPECTIRTAVITITTDHPVISADYFIFNDKTLIRFPWAIDAKI